MAVARGFPGSGASMTHVVALATDSNPPANGRAPAAGVRERVRAARRVGADHAVAGVRRGDHARVGGQRVSRAVAVKSEPGSYEVFRAMPQGVAVANAAFEVFASDCRVGAKVHPRAARREPRSPRSRAAPRARG